MPDHQHDEHHADEDLLRRGEPHARQERDHVLGESAAFEKAEKNQRAEERPAVVAAAAEDEGEPDEQAFLRQEHVRLDGRGIVREEDAGAPPTASRADVYAPTAKNATAPRFTSPVRPHWTFSPSVKSARTPTSVAMAVR